MPIGISHDPHSSMEAAVTVARAFDATVRLFAVMDPKSTKALEEFATVEGVTLEEAGRVHLERLARDLIEDGIAAEVNVVFSDHTAEAIATRGCRVGRPDRARNPRAAWSGALDPGKCHRRRGATNRCTADGGSASRC